MADSHRAGERLENLEVKLSYLEDLVDGLNLSIYRQQEQIDLLIREVNKLRQQTSDEPAGGSRGAADELPPHY